MLSVGGLGALSGIVDALYKGGGSDVISEAVKKQMEEMGTDLLRDLVSEFIPSVPGLGRVQKALMTGGASEFNQARNSWLNRLRPAPLPGTGILQSLSKKLGDNLPSRPEGKYWSWSQSRREWLNRDWRHDWRTQPRDFHGRWVPGRLKTPFIPRRLKRQKRALRRIARKTAKGIRF